MVVQISLTLVSTTTVGSGGAASIEFTNIPQTGKDLLLLISGRRSDGGVIGTMQFNSDTGSNYSYRHLLGNGSTASSSNNSGVELQYYAYPASTYTANTFGNVLVTVANYTSSNEKSISIDGVTENNATTSFQAITAGRWTGTSAINSVKVGVSLETNTSASLYIIS